MNKFAIETVRDFRLQVDGLMALNREGRPFQSIHAPFKTQKNKEWEQAYDSLKFAKGWMGKILEGLHTDSPYKNDGKRDSVKDIEPTAEVSHVVDAIIKAHPDTEYTLRKAFIFSTEEPTLINKENGFVYFSDLEYVQKVDWLREQIKKVVIAFLGMNPLPGKLIGICITNAYTHLSEARFHLGFELQRLREETAQD